MKTTSVLETLIDNQYKKKVENNETQNLRKRDKIKRKTDPTREEE